MAQKRRKEKQMKQKQRMQTLLCFGGALGAVLLSLLVCLLVFDIRPEAQQVSAPVATALPYEASAPFTVSDLTAAQLISIRESGRISVSDGPRGVALGDTLETVLDRFPVSYMGDQPEEMQILYCAEVFENQNGLTTVLPPRGLLTANNGYIEITLLAPTSAYPAGTHDNYGSYEHVYCIFTIEPDSMTISSIELGIDQ